MSLAIDVDQVWEVLLADGWHKCLPYGPDTEPKRSSFTLDAYEFIESPRASFASTPDIHMKWGELPHIPEGCSSTGFRFTDDKGDVFGPVTSILAVRCC